MKSRYTTIIGTDDQITQFLTAIKNPVDDIIDRVCMLTDMAPDPLLFNIFLRGSSADVQDMFKSFYDKGCDYIAFTSASRNTSYFSVADVSRRVFAHEVTHIILNKMCPKLSIVCQEILAQEVESKI